MEKADIEMQRTKLEEQLRQIDKRDIDIKSRFRDVNDRIENVQIGLDSPDFLISQLPSAIQILRDDLMQLSQKKKAIQKEIDDLRAERKKVNEQLNNLMNPCYGLQKT
jgi:chromosome segregation ATPase